MRDVKSRSSLRALLCVLAVAVLAGGCSVAGRVYIAFFWSDSDIPDAGFSCTAPNVPAAVTSIVRGRYYETVPGRYSLSYSYSTLESHSLTFDLAVESTMLGQEHAYYHATLRKSSPPTVLPYP
jgi:hypothetical protein